MWRKAKKSLGLNFCAFVPSSAEDNDEAPFPVYSIVRSSSVTTTSLESLASSGLRLSKSLSASSKRKCVICFGSMKPGGGNALFTAECSHTFHFSCIASNVKHGNFVCPVCRADWKQIPLQCQATTELPNGKSRVNPINFSQEMPPMAAVSSSNRSSSNRQHHRTSSRLPPMEPSSFNDDEPLDLPSDASTNAPQALSNSVEIKAYTEFSAVGEKDCIENFGIVIHLRAPHGTVKESHGQNVNANSMVSQTSRAPIDLVTVLDVSHSMAGTKLALLKRAMGFVIQNLGPSDRLSVVSFSSAARRLFPLRRMTDIGRQLALQAVNSLSSKGGTNIAEGLRKGAKVIEERNEKNPVCSIILLSDGQDTYTLPSCSNSSRNYRMLVPPSILEAKTNKIPVHAFGFGADHDSAAMHGISQVSGGTFSFIESENTIQDAFAQCIGGLLSVVVQDMQVSIECVHPGVRLVSVNSGSYSNEVTCGTSALINVGDLYADEERDFLITVNVPQAIQGTDLLRVSGQYRGPMSSETVILENNNVSIQRPSVVLSNSVSIEVDRERNRIEAASAMSDARLAAERGCFSDAVAILESSRRKISESLAGCSGDQLCQSLDEELKEMQGRMANRHRYEVSGRAYLLSGLSSHSSQRAVARTSEIHSGSLYSSYQTPSMTEMLQRSQSPYTLPSGPITPIRPIPR